MKAYVLVIFGCALSLVGDATPVRQHSGFCKT